MLFKNKRKGTWRRRKETLIERLVVFEGFKGLKRWGYGRVLIVRGMTWSF